ncbi:hypothetical protein AB0J38_41105 [Streptomyces sp. NPDC050095]|uniref:hypothetical protein n=1 Tax=unclassified Streptomyces TaxID=2593676 RepID=UPI0034266886
MSWDWFWKMIEEQLKELESAKSAEDVIRILKSEESSAGDAFFAGSGGDETVYGALHKAGWMPVWEPWEGFYVMKAPDGSLITYIEGDIYRGDRRA